MLFNIIKHARANNADVSIEINKNFIVISVEDNGIGFNYCEKNIRSGKERGFGLFSLRERLISCGGCFDVTSEPGQGTKVTLVAPLIGKEEPLP